MIFYAVVSDEIHQVIEFFASRREAELMLKRVRGDEPAWVDLLRIERIELVSGTAT